MCPAGEPPFPAKEEKRLASEAGRRGGRGTLPLPCHQQQGTPQQVVGKKNPARIRNIPGQGPGHSLPLPRQKKAPFPTGSPYRPRRRLPRLCLPMTKPRASHGEKARGFQRLTGKPSDGFREQVHHRPLYMVRRSGRVRPPFCFLAWRSAGRTRRASSWPARPAWRNLPSGARRGRPEPCGSGRRRPETGRKSAWNRTSRFRGRRR